MTAVAVQQNGEDRQQYNPRQSAQSSRQSSSQTSRASSHTANVTTQYSQNGSPSRVETMNGGQPNRVARIAAGNTSTRATNGANMRAASGPSAASHARALSSNPSIASTLDDGQNPAPISRSATTTGANSAFTDRGRESSQDDSEVEKTKRRPKPLLTRAKSDYGPRGDGTDGEVAPEAQDWGSRHGFDDHYASEEYVSLLANVGCSFFITVKVC